MESRQGLSRRALALFPTSELFLRMDALVGLCCHGCEYPMVAVDVDRPDRHGVGSPEGHGHSVDGATGSREPGRGISNLSTDNEFVHSLVPQDEIIQGAFLRASRRVRAVAASLLVG